MGRKASLIFDGTVRGMRRGARLQAEVFIISGPYYGDLVVVRAAGSMKIGTIVSVRPADPDKPEDDWLIVPRAIK